VLRIRHGQPGFYLFYRELFYYEVCLGFLATYNHKAGAVMTGATGYAGDVMPRGAWDRLASEPEAVLVDVRTRAEWTFVGITDLTAIGKAPLLVEWQTFPDMAVNGTFPDTLSDMLREQGLGTDAKLFMLCRSGARSRSAAQAMCAAGYANAYNIATGFEGDLDENGKRGTLGGWKADGLPWRQG